MMGDMIGLSGVMRLRAARVSTEWSSRMFHGLKLIRAGMLAALLAGPSAWAETVHFEKDVAPIFQANCTGCHGTQVKLKDLNLTTEETALKGGESGAVVVPGKPEDSILYKKVKSGAMPMGKPHLSEKDIATISSWIRDRST